MNWFQRYAIPGLFFMLLVCSFNGILFLDNLSVKKEYLTALIAAAVGFSLPIGYILAITSQLFYLRWGLWNALNTADRMMGQDDSTKQRYRKY